MTSPIGPSGSLPSARRLSDHIAAEGERERAGWTAFELRPATGIDVPTSSKFASATPAIGLSPEHARCVRRLIEQLQAEGLVRSWWFLRKPPGYRVRLLRNDRSPAATALLDGAVAAWSAREGHDLEASPAVYEPEQARFGGRTGMMLAHRHFASDSDAALDIAAVADQSASRCPADLLSAALTNDLLGRIVNDRAELFDVWRRLADAVSSVCRIPVTRMDPAVATARASLAPDLAAVIPGALHSLVARVQRSNNDLSVEVRNARASIPVRSWAAQVTVFHWNRFGLTTAELGPLVAGMCAVLGP